MASLSCCFAVCAFTPHHTNADTTTEETTQPPHHTQAHYTHTHTHADLAALLPAKEYHDVRIISTRSFHSVVFRKLFILGDVQFKHTPHTRAHSHAHTHTRTHRRAHCATPIHHEHINTVSLDAEQGSGERAEAAEHGGEPRSPAPRIKASAHSLGRHGPEHGDG